MDIKKTAEVAGQLVSEEAQKSAEKIKARKSAELIGDDFWAWWGRTSPPNNKAKEILPPGGPPAKKGGSKNRSKRNKKAVRDLRRYVWG